MSVTVREGAFYTFNGLLALASRNGWDHKWYWNLRLAWMMSYTSILSTLVSAQVQNSAIESTRQAYRDIDAVHDYIARDNPIAAQGVLDKIEAMIDHLPRNPALGRAGRVMRTRELVVPSVPYIVVYSLEEEFIDILAIIHTARRWPVRFRRSQHG